MEDMLGGTLSKYLIVDHIGAGSMFLARDITNNMKVAIKQHPVNSHYAINKDELTILMSIQYENILNPLDILELHPYIYIVYEYCPGDNLADYVNKRSGLAEDDARQVMRQILIAYKELKRNNVLHGNIKPQNILVVQEPQLVVKLCDFGIIEKSSLSNELYMAPEIINKTTQFNQMADIWSIGAIMYFMINGQPPKETIEEKKLNNYSIKNTISSHCLDFILACLQYEASTRLTYNEMTVHPFIIEEAHAINKNEEELKAIINIGYTEENKACNSAKDDTKVIKIAMNNTYICYCKTKHEVILGCGHSFCMGCIAQIRDKSVFEKQETECFIKKIDNPDDKKDYRFVMIKCPKCLAFYKINKLNLHCECIFDENSDIDALITRFDYDSENTHLMYCKHEEILTLFERYVIYGEFDNLWEKNHTTTTMRIVTVLGSNTTTLDFYLYHPDARNYHAINDDDVKVIALALKENNRLTTLKLNGNRISDEGVKVIAMALKDNITLTRLYLRKNGINAKGAKALAIALKYNNTLTTLDLSENGIYDDGVGAIAEALHSNNTLSMLDLSHNRIYTDDMIAIAKALKNNNTLTALDLSHNTIHIEDLTEIVTALKYNKTLTTLNLRYCVLNIEGAKVIGSLLKDNNILTKLYLTNNYIGDEGAKAIAIVLKNNHVLTTLDLSKNAINFKGAKAMAITLTNNNTLTTLDLSSNNIGDKGAKEIAIALHSNNSLNTLNLQLNNINYKGANEIAMALTDNKILTILDLSNNNIVDKGAKIIAMVLKYNNTLIKLYLSYNNIHSEGAIAISRALKDNTSLTHLDLSNFL